MTDLRDTSRDERLLAAHGYRQELERGLSLWSSFSVGFATISPVVGIYSVMSLGAMSMGPSWVWVVPLCLLLQFGVALVYAELSSQFPLAGGCYQWVRRLVGDRLAWFTGFLYLASALASLTTVAYLGGFWLGLLATGAPPSANGQVLCGALLLALGLAVNLLGINPLKYFVNAGIVAEAIASIGIGVLLLLFFRNHPLDLLFSGPGGTGDADGSYLDGVLTALAVGGWAFLGFDACSQISEETTDARVSTPRAILRSMLVVGFTVMLTAFAVTLSYQDIGAVVSGQVVDPVTPAVVDAFGAWARRSGADRLRRLRGVGADLHRPGDLRHGARRHPARLRPAAPGRPAQGADGGDGLQHAAGQPRPGPGAERHGGRHADRVRQRRFLRGLPDRRRLRSLGPPRRPLGPGQGRLAPGTRGAGGERPGSRLAVVRGAQRRLAAGQPRPARRALVPGLGGGRGVLRAGRVRPALHGHRQAASAHRHQPQLRRSAGGLTRTRRPFRRLLRLFPHAGFAPGGARLILLSRSIAMSDLHYWNYPTDILCGVGALEQLPRRCALAGARRPLLVTDPGMLALEPLRLVRECLERAGIDHDLFHELSSNPSLAEVHGGARRFEAGGHDALIALGGGSALDAAKGIALLSRDPHGLERFEWTQTLRSYPTLADYPPLGLPPLLALPTTAGTGSELGREAVLTDTQLGIKRVVGHRELLAACVFLDPRLTRGLPPALSAATGMDALTHHLEALFSPLYHPMSAGIALEGVRLVRQHLENAVRDGNDLAAREGMLVASASAAVAFQKGLGGVHALAHPLGARHHLHHGLLNAVLLPYVLLANRPAIEADAARLARYLELDEASFDGLLAWILELRARIGIPANLAALGLDGEDAQWVGEQALADLSSSATNALPLDARDYARIYRQAVAGTLA